MDSPVSAFKSTDENLNTRENLHLLHQLLNTMQEGVAIANIDGAFKYANSAFYELYRYNLNELTAMHFENLFHRDSLNVFEQFMKDLSELEHFSGEALNLRKDGSLFHTHFKGQALDFDGEPCFMAVIRDNTDRKAMEKALHDSEKRTKPPSTTPRNQLF